jgi:hypothetical protein
MPRHPAAEAVGRQGVRSDPESEGFEEKYRAAINGGYCGAQDTFYVGNMKGVGHIYQQTFIDTYAKVAFAKLYDRKTPITAAEILNDRVLPFFEEHGIVLCRVLRIAAPSIAATPSITTTSSISPSRTSITPAPRPRARRRMESASASIEPCSTSSIAWRSARKFIGPSTGCRPISKFG